MPGLLESSLRGCSAAPADFSRQQMLYGFTQRAVVLAARSLQPGKSYEIGVSPSPRGSSSTLEASERSLTFCHSA